MKQILTLASVVWIEMARRKDIYVLLKEQASFSTFYASAQAKRLINTARLFKK